MAAQTHVRVKPFTPSSSRAPNRRALVLSQTSPQPADLQAGHLLRIATRFSPLALEQTRQVADCLASAAAAEGLQLRVETVTFQTRGDVDKMSSMRALGPGAFTAELDEAVAMGAADLAVHSLKDAPPVCHPGLVLGGCLAREDVRDAVLIRPGCASLDALPSGSKVGTSSSRRKAQILSRYPSLQVVPVRGSVEARLAALQRGDLDATVLALSGLKRLHKEQLATQVLEVTDMLPAACQGAIGVMCRADDTLTQRLLSQASHLPTLLEVTCERAFLAELMGSPPSMPRCAVACHASPALPAGSTTSKSTSCGENSGTSMSTASIMSSAAPLSLQLDCMVLADNGSRQRVEQGKVELVGERCKDLQAAAELGQEYGLLIAGYVEEMVAVQS